jgi:hypothetical protein
MIPLIIQPVAATAITTVQIQRAAHKYLDQRTRCWRSIPESFHKAPLYATGYPMAT